MLFILLTPSKVFMYERGEHHIAERQAKVKVFMLTPAGKYKRTSRGKNYDNIILNTSIIRLMSPICFPFALGQLVNSLEPSIREEEKPTKHQNFFPKVEASTHAVKHIVLDVSHTVVILKRQPEPMGRLSPLFMRYLIFLPFTLSSSFRFQNP